ncbi:MAG: hypothetical protein M3P44_12125 [Actinomycetota bacterium]|nr:hypothetical protein [Actinomycetota bacterium]
MPPSTQVHRRRRLIALGLVAAAAALTGAAVGAGGDTAKTATTASGDVEVGKPAKPAELPMGGRTIFPRFRIVAFYGAPQDAELGELGIGTPASAGRRLLDAARPYQRKTRPVLPAMELVATVANDDPGTDGLYRSRQTDAVVGRYLKAARKVKALLLLDIQPGHADFMSESEHLARWLREPDVGLALDPEWHTPGVVPGTRIGSTNARAVNEVSRWLATMVREHDLPQKLFVVHQFTSDMVADKQAVERPRELAVTMNVDGFGSRANKVSKYRLFTHDGVRFNDGFKLFYREDVGLMKPRSVLGLTPPPDLIVYE